MVERIYGLSSDNKNNIHFWDTLTADGSTPSVQVNGTVFGFVDKVVGSSVTISHQGSLNGTDWFELEEHSHTQSGTDAHFYSGRPMRFVRATVSNIGDGESATCSVIVN